ncbi:MAG: hypothetical protein E6Q83_09370 [Thiothrix sp.]|nr:MAG: hypothetical protein E6Q83_09370 [Thiothrix sp.]
MNPLATAQTIYAAFGRGDIPAIIEQLSPDIAWEYAYAANAIPVPWFQPQQGQAGALNFFKELADNLVITQFNVHHLLAGDQIVVAVFDLTATVKRSGKIITERDAVHIWRFDESGKVKAFRHCEDTYQQAMAYQI